MNEFGEILRQALPEIISGLVVAAILALIGIAARRRAVRAAPNNQRVSSSNSPSYAEPPSHPSLTSPPVHPTATSPLPLLESPTFTQLLYFARRGQCRLFIGSGVSSEAGMPGVQALRDALRAELIEMGSSVPAGATLPEVATALKKAVGRIESIGTLQSVFDEALLERPWERGAYLWIPRLREDLVKKIYTTNWDDLLKRAFEKAGEVAREIYDPRDLPLIPSTGHTIVKVHRDFHSRDGPIVTEADYAIALHDIQQGTAGTLWGHLADQLAQFRFVFVGYSLGDPTFNLIRQAVKLRTDTVGERRHFLVAPLSEEEERMAKQCSGMHPIVAGASKFFQALAQKLKE